MLRTQKNGAVGSLGTVSRAQDAVGERVGEGGLLGRLRDGFSLLRGRGLPGFERAAPAYRPLSGKDESVHFRTVGCPFPDTRADDRSLIISGLGFWHCFCS